MRGANQTFKNANIRLEEHVRSSERIASQVAQHKESISPYLSNTKMSDGREMWFQYLPNENQPHNQQYSSLSREDPRNDNYLHSLERRLEKLFREEKEMLRERHHKKERISSDYDLRERGSTNNQMNSSKETKSPYNIDHMDRKIRELEERYRRQQLQLDQRQSRQKSAEGKKQSNLPHMKGTRERSIEQSNKIEAREKIQSEYSPTYNKNLLTQSVEDCVAKEKYLQEEVQLLKVSVRQLRESNQELFKRVQRRDDKKKHKQRTKELLQNILHKLEFINVELKTCKKRESKQNGGSMTRIEKETSDLFQEFQLLQLQYKHLEEERKKVERRQTEIENKLTRITSPKEEAVP